MLSPQTERSALWTSRGAPPVMRRPHRHDDIEVNAVRTGSLRYLFGGSDISLGPGDLAVFWGATPHQLVRPGTSDDGDVLWLHVPLTTVLTWDLSRDRLDALLQPAPLIARAGESALDPLAAMARWQADVAAGDRDIAFLEIHALLMRLLRGEPATGGAPRTGPGDAVVVMTRTIAQRFREPISPAEVAAATHLSPTYAMTLFREAVGCTIGVYLTRCRVAEAQRLLVTTRAGTADIGQRAGFGSQTQFYEHFTRLCGCSPARYRARVGEQLAQAQSER